MIRHHYLVICLEPFCHPVSFPLGCGFFFIVFKLFDAVEDILLHLGGVVNVDEVKFGVCYDDVDVAVIEKQPVKPFPLVFQAEDVLDRG